VRISPATFFSLRRPLCFFAHRPLIPPTAAGYGWGRASGAPGGWGKHLRPAIARSISSRTWLFAWGSAPSPNESRELNFLCRREIFDDIFLLITFCSPRPSCSCLILVFFLDPATRLGEGNSESGLLGDSARTPFGRTCSPPSTFAAVLPPPFQRYLDAGTAHRPGLDTGLRLRPVRQRFDPSFRKEKMFLVVGGDYKRLGIPGSRALVSLRLP